ncbi:hypothetical protein AB0O47_39890, partial [Streptomyces noursei]
TEAADDARGRQVPAAEEGYEPAPGARSYAERQVLAALETAGIPLKGEAVEFSLTVMERGENGVQVAIHHTSGPGAKPRRGAARDRWELRRAELLMEFLEAGMYDVEMLTVGLAVKVPRPRGAETIVQLGERDYGHNFDAKFIERPVSFPQYPQITGWVMRLPWGERYMGPMWPWMHHRGTGENLGRHARDEHQAARILAQHYGLLEPVRVWS